MLLLTALSDSGAKTRLYRVKELRGRPSMHLWRHDTQHNDIQHNDIQHNNIQHNGIQLNGE
jgi:hypothetical protein